MLRTLGAVGALLLALTTTTATLAAAPAPMPPAPPRKLVSETLFGTTLVDPYRYMENEQDPAVIEWIKAEGRYTRGVLDAVPGHAALLARISALTGSFDFVHGIQKAGGRTFYQERIPGSDNFDLMVRDADGTKRKLIDVAAVRAAHGGIPLAINYYRASPDGTKVAVGQSEGGSENAALSVYDATTGALVAGPIPLAQYGGVNWTTDSQQLFVNLLNPLKPGEPTIAKYKNSKIYLWDLKSAPLAVLGSGLPGPITFKPDESPYVIVSPGTPAAVAANINGVQNELALWTAPLEEAMKPGAAWQALATRDDGITSITAAGRRLFYLSHKNAPTFQVLAGDIGQPASAARVIVAARPGRLIEAISAASDGLYVQARQGVYSQLFKVPLAGGPEEPLALPFKGSISDLYADQREPGAVITGESWTIPPTVLSYDPAVRRFTDLHMGGVPAGFDSSRYVATDLVVRARDGVGVPLSYLGTVGGLHPRPLLLWAYGSYGISQFPAFGPRVIASLSEGIDYAVCHVRGGGELGEAWRLGGKDANKTNTWRDLIACAQDVIARGYTTKKLLFIGGGSAGGITMGRAMEERPDLFAGVFDLVPSANAVRQEFSPNGPGNTPEFGTVANELGFRNLLAMDSVLNVKPGVQYPAVMITTGLNDPRVSSWEPAKLAATLRASGTSAPVLLRVDEKAGHGIGSTRTQSDELYADILTFIKLRTAAP